MNPRLRKTNEGQVIDWVFQSVPSGNLNADVYHDDEYQHDASLKDMSLAEARAFWKGLVDSGFERIRTP